MDSCYVVEKEVQKVLCKFEELQKNSNRSFQECLDHIQRLKTELNQCE